MLPLTDLNAAAHMVIQRRLLGGYHHRAANIHRAIHRYYPTVTLVDV